MAEINDLSTTDASNTARFPENQAPSSVNDGARALEGLIARGLKDIIDGAVTTGGTSTAYTVAANRTLTAYYDGLTQCVKWHTASGATPTINIDGIGAKSIYWPNGTQVTTNDLPSGARSLIQYDGTNFQVLTTTAPSLTTPVSIANGGTGAGTASAAFTALKQDATESATGVVEIATAAEVATGTDAVRSITPATLDGVINGKTDTVIVAGDSIAFADASDSNKMKKDTVQGILDLVPTSGITLGTEQATTSGTSKDFTGIPAGTKKIIINLVGVSTNGADEFIIQIGDAGGIETSGYVSVSNDVVTITGSTAGFIINSNSDALFVYHGSVILTLEDSSDFTWVMLSTLVTTSSGNIVSFSAGSKSLSAELTQLRLTTTGGANTFDAGVVNISYQ